MQTIELNKMGLEETSSEDQKTIDGGLFFGDGGCVPPPKPYPYPTPIPYPTPYPRILQ